MRRVEKEILKKFDKAGLIDAYNCLKEFEYEELVILWNSLPWKELPKEKDIHKAVMLMAMKDVLGKERAKKKKAS